MQIPFSIEDFLGVFRQYNSDVWPMQILLFILGLGSVILIFAEFPEKHQIITIVLSFLWLWMGVVYHIIYFTPINPIARGFGLLFIAQAILLAYFGVYRNELQYRPDKTIWTVSALIILTYGLIIYPMLSNRLGHYFPAAPTFGLPCPTTIFTLGILLLATPVVRWYFLVIPICWSLIGVSAAINLSMKEDYFLGLAGLLSIILVLSRRRRLRMSG